MGKFMKIFERFKKRRILKSYVRVLSRLLKKRYGKRKRYTEAQVRKTINSAGLNESYIDYKKDISEKYSINFDDYMMNVPDGKLVRRKKEE